MSEGAPEDNPQSVSHPGVASRTRRQQQGDPWGFVVRAMAYETLVVLVTAVSVAALFFLSSLLLLTGQLQDVYLRLRGPAPVTHEVALLTVGPEALYLYNPDDPDPETTPRALLAELVHFLDEAGASVVVLDFLLDRPTEDDALLAAAAAEHGAVLAAERFTVTEPASGRVFTPGIPPTLEATMGSGFANFQEEGNTLFGSASLVRRLPLVQITDHAHLAGTWPHNLVGSKQDIDQRTPSLSLAAAWLHRQRQSGAAISTTEPLLAQLAADCPAPPAACALDADALGLPALPLALDEPLDINFRGPEGGDGLVTLDAARVLRVLAQAAIVRELTGAETLEVPADIRARIEGRVVVVGRVGGEHAERDRFATPYSLPLPDRADMSGPRIHAHVIDTLLSGRHIRHRGGWLAWALAFGAIAAVVGTYPRLSDTRHGLIWLTVAAGLLVGGFVVFRFTDGLVFDLGPAVTACVVAVVLLHLRGWVREQAGLPR